MGREFRDFLTRGDVVELAVAFILGAAFVTVVRSMLNDILMPPIGLLLGNVDFINLFVVLQQGDPAGPYVGLAQAKEAGAITINYGAFVLAVVSFLVVALVMFVLVRLMFKLHRQRLEEEAVSRECSYCFSSIHMEATRCPRCTSRL